MTQILDFNKVKKNYFTVTLNDEKKTKLLIMTPTKKLLTELSTMLPDNTDEIPSEEDLNALYELTARLMNRNKTGVKVTGDQLAEILDFEDLIIFFNAYSEFIAGAANEKN